MESKESSVATKIAACYCRVSTQRQAERQTIGQPLKLVPKIAKSHGYTPYPSTCVDDGISGERHSLGGHDFLFSSIPSRSSLRIEFDPNGTSLTKRKTLLQGKVKRVFL